MSVLSVNPLNERFPAPYTTVAVPCIASQREGSEEHRSVESRLRLLPDICSRLSLNEYDNCTVVLQSKASQWSTTRESQEE